MAAIGVRELKQRTSAVLERVRLHGETVEVTFRGRVVARIVPVAPAQPPHRRRPGATWAAVDALADEIGAAAKLARGADDWRRDL